MSQHIPVARSTAAAMRSQWSCNRDTCPLLEREQVKGQRKPELVGSGHVMSGYPADQASFEGTETSEPVDTGPSGLPEDPDGRPAEDQATVGSVPSDQRAAAQTTVMGPD